MTQQQYPGQFSQSARSEGGGAASGRTGEFFRFRDSLPRRSREHRILGGVCGGLANKWNVNAWLVRITFILFVVPLGYVYYLGAQNMPDPATR